MIRFCDGEIDCIDYASLTKEAILDYFLPDHMKDVLYVYDAFDTMRYVGFITYDSYQQATNIESVIRRESVILRSDMWQDAREYFSNRMESLPKDILLPVLDKEHRLLCFAYEDKDANREIRMLRELIDTPDALQFADIYPECQCVKIYGFNELAYFFAKYLAEQKVAVEVSGTMWQGVFKGIECQMPDYRCMSIYAEEAGQRNCDCTGGVLRSASVQFECIDKIYEENIVKGIIKDTEMEWEDLLGQLRSEKEIIIIGTSVQSANAYDLLMCNGIDIFCFLSDEINEQKYRFLGKKVLPEREIRKRCSSPVFLECNSENSAWGFGEVDRFDYLGYHRNKQYFLLKDYIEIYIGNLQNILKYKNVILLGNVRLCKNIYHTLENVEGCKAAYWDILNEGCDSVTEMSIIDGGQAADADFCMLIEPEYYSDAKHIQLMRQKKNLYYKKLKENGINNVTDYFSNREVLIHIQKKDVEKYTIPCLTPGKILIDISEHMSGINFFINLLDGHPDILMLSDLDILSNNLYFMCIELAEEKSGDILKTFWKIFDQIRISENSIILRRKSIFNEKFEELLKYKEYFTSQEVFVMFHIVCVKMMWGRDIESVQNRVIYWVHHAMIPKESNTEYEEWLCSDKVKGFSITLTRNAYTRLGCWFKLCERMQTFSYSNIKNLWNHMGYLQERKKPPACWTRFEMKFETIKTMPRETLADFCNRLGILWNDCLLETTCYGELAEYPSGNEKISGFDLRPVYNLYEEYFSDFDRFRINMIFSRAQRMFGYPYVSSREFSRRELADIFMKEFRFEDKLSWEKEEWRIQFRQEMIEKINEYLQRERREELMCGV